MKVAQNDLIWYGRNFTKDNVTYFDYSASGFEFCFTGTKAQMAILSDSANWNETKEFWESTFQKLIQVIIKEILCGTIFQKM